MVNWNVFVNLSYREKRGHQDEYKRDFKEEINEHFAMAKEEEEDEQAQEERHRRALIHRRRTRTEQEEAPLEQEDLEEEADEVG